MNIFLLLLLFLCSAANLISAEFYEFYGMSDFPARFPRNLPARQLPFRTNNVFAYQQHRQSPASSLPSRRREGPVVATKLVAQIKVEPTLTRSSNYQSDSGEQERIISKEEYEADDVSLAPQQHGEGQGQYHNNGKIANEEKQTLNVEGDDRKKVSVESDAKSTNTFTLLDLKFASNFTAFDPRDPDSLFEFPVIDDSTDLLEDNAAFLYDKKSHLVDMISVPLSRWLPQSSGAAAARAAYDGAAKLTSSIRVAEGNTLKVTYRFRCRTINTSRSKFLKEAIKKPEDDPRLGACDVNVVDYEKSGLSFGISLTNRGIWARYNRDQLSRAFLNSTYEAFRIYRRVALRDDASELVSVRIEIDNDAKQTRYYVNDVLVWIVKNWGVLSKDLFPYGNKRNRLVSYSAGTSVGGQRQNNRAVKKLGKFTVFLNNVKKLDEADPNDFDDDINGGQYSPALVRVTDLPNYYDPNVQFYDEKSKRFSSLWGQGVVAGLHSLLVEIQRQPPEINNERYRNNKNQREYTKSGRRE